MARHRREPEVGPDQGLLRRTGGVSPGVAASSAVAPTSPASLLHLQRLAGNQAVAGLLESATGAGAGSAGVPVQRVKDGWGQELSPANLALAPPFRDKHVAVDADDAIEATDWRFRNGKMPPSMARGAMPNTVATPETWLAALAASPTQVETQNAAWTKGVRMKVAEAWQVRWRPADQEYDVTEVSSLPLTAGGYAEAVKAGRGRNTSKQVVDGTFLLDHIEN